MSKSRGNVANPIEALETYGVDPIRYYMMSVAGNFQDDSGDPPNAFKTTLVTKDRLLDWSEEHIAIHYDRDLRGVMGNLLSRVTSPAFTSLVTSSGRGTEEKHTVASYALLDQNISEDALIRQMLEEASQKFERHFSRFEIGKALKVAMDLVNEVGYLLNLSWFGYGSEQSKFRQTGISAN